MIQIYVSMLLLILVFKILYRIKRIKFIRVFGLELTNLLFCLLIITVIIGEVFLPIPEYYIKNSSGTLDEILEDHALNSGVKFDTGSFKILDSHGMHFNHLFLCSYEINHIEEVRLIHFEKNIFGNMKPKYPMNEDIIITKSSKADSFYKYYIDDGIFAGYNLVVGFGDDSVERVNYRFDKFVIDNIYPRGYFMWIEMVREPWKSLLVRAILFTLVIFVISRFSEREKVTVKFYSRWEKGNNIILIVWE